jgi:Flp pilus assembly protein TadD
VRSHPNLNVLVLLLLLLATAALYVPLLGNTFVGLDVGLYGPLLFHEQFFDTAARVVGDFKGEVIQGYYAPLSALSLMLDRHLVMSATPVPKATLLINLLIHVINGFLVYLLLARLKMPAFVALFTAAVFLMHPLQASSVLWFAERKTLLSQLFCLTSFILYVEHRLKGSTLRYWLSLLAFAGSLLSKPISVTFPLLLLITEMFGLSRLSGEQLSSTGAANAPADADPLSLPGAVRLGALSDPANRKAMIGLAPFFVLAGLWALLVIHTEPTQGWLPMQHRPFIAAGALLFYVGTFLLPVRLMYIYPFWHVDACSSFWWLVLIAVIAICGAIYGLRKHISARMGWALANFLVPLLPCLGFFEFGSLQLSFVANHFLYPALMGIALALALALHAALTGNKGFFRYGALGIVIAYGVLLPFQTAAEVRTWKTSQTLWADTLEKNPRSWMAHYQMGLELMNSRDFVKAAEHFQRCTEIQPDYPYARYMHGQALLEMGKPEEALASYRRAIQLNPRFPDAYNDAAIALTKLGRNAEAVESYRTAINLAPDRASFYVNLGMCLLQTGRPVDAVPVLQRAVALDPGIQLAHALLARALELSKGQDGAKPSDEPQMGSQERKRP